MMQNKLLKLVFKFLIEDHFSFLALVFHVEYISCNLNDIGIRKISTFYFRYYLY